MIDTGYKLPINPLIKSDNHILYEIPPGKPDPNQPCFFNQDKRERVFQSAQKGACCSYYTFRFIRRMIGKKCCEELKFQRGIEKLCSERRKKIINYDENIFPIQISEFYNESFASLLKTFNKEKAKKMLEDNQISSIFNLIPLLEGGSSIVPFVENFFKEEKFENLYEYLLDRRCRDMIELNKEFLRVLKDELRIDTGADQLFSHEKWKMASISEQYLCLETFIREIHIDLYDLKKSKWDPSQDIDQLIKELKNKGPLMIGGRFGKSVYVDSPYKLKDQLGGRDIYAWKSGTKRTDLLASHAVLLVGAEKVKERAYVYFIDSHDPSDPKDPSKQMIYKISKENLDKNIEDLVGCWAYHGSFDL